MKEGGCKIATLGKIAGVIYGSKEIFLMERKNREALVDLPIYRMLYLQIRKMAALKNHIWVL